MPNPDSRISPSINPHNQAIDLTSLLKPALVRWRQVLMLGLAGGAIGYAVSMILPASYTARMSFLSPQPQQSSAASALASLGALSNLAGAAGAIKSPADQYVTLLQSTTIADRMIDRFSLMETYEAKFRVEARKELTSKTRVAAGKKDSLISVEVDDQDPQRAADMANAYIEELQRMTNGLSLTEAQQRRAFFQKQLEETKENLTSAQRTLEKTGFTGDALRTEPKSSAESYARLKAELVSTEIKLQASRRSLAEQSPEIQQLLATANGIRDQLMRVEQPRPATASQDYVSSYRNFKYQEALFEIYARQFELAKLDESRDGTVFQIIDKASKPERRSKPIRRLYAAGGFAAGVLISSLSFVWLRRRRAPKPEAT